MNLSNVKVDSGTASVIDLAILSIFNILRKMIIGNRKLRKVGKVRRGKLLLRQQELLQGPLKLLLPIMVLVLIANDTAHVMIIDR